MSSPAEERKAETREMIFQAAKKVFGEKGYHNAQIADIVRIAGTSTGTIYAHFQDKRDLFEQIVRESLEALRATMLELSRTGTPGDARERIGQWKPAFQAFFDYVDQNPEQIILIVRGGFGVDERQDTLIWEHFNAFADDIADDFRKWEALGFIQGVNAKLLGHMIIGMSSHVAVSYLMEKEFTRTEAIDNLMATLFSMVTRHLTAMGREALGDMAAPKIEEAP
jgi:AcrR family transcriptional regulator